MSPVRHGLGRKLPANLHQVSLHFIYEKGHSVIEHVFILASASFQLYLAQQLFILN
jgi:hypothetical protein